jgi:hypothetical protein
MQSPRENSVRDLKNLYSAVAGLGLALAVYNLLDINRSPVPVRWELFPFFVAFLVTLLPFYHGALRHLDITYIEHGGKQIASGALFVDFLMLFFESCLLLALAVLIPKPRMFAEFLTVLIGFDTLWGFGAYLAVSHGGKTKAELYWAYINLGATFLLIVFLNVADIIPYQIREKLFWVILLGLSIIRTIIDYAVCWRFYYPSIPPSNS